jgi:hypothetical protein
MGARSGYASDIHVHAASSRGCVAACRTEAVLARTINIYTAQRRLPLLHPWYLCRMARAAVDIWLGVAGWGGLTIFKLKSCCT